MKYTKLFEEFKKEKEKKDLTVTFENLAESDLKELQKLFSAMNYAGAAGASREIKLYVDGDGSFRSKIKMSIEPSDELTKEALDEYSESKLSIGLGC